MLSPAFAIVLAVFGVVVLFAIQPLILQLSCAVTGQKVPTFFASVGTVIAAFIASLLVGFLWSLTGGLILAQFSGVLAAVAGLVVSMLVVSVVYSASLRIALNKAVGVALVGHVIGLVFTGGFALVIRSLWQFVG